MFWHSIHICKHFGFAMANISNNSKGDEMANAIPSPLLHLHIFVFTDIILQQN
jgi:hypothetical protein